MLDILKFVFSGFYVWSDSMLPGLVILQAVLFSVSRFLRFCTITINGWPPSHLDADGDFKRPASDEDND